MGGCCTGGESPQKPAKEPLLAGESKKFALIHNQWQDVKLLERRELTHNSILVRFALPNQDDSLGLPPGRHISIKFDDGSKHGLSRSYTPVSTNDQLGSFDIALRVYPEGKMSQFLNKAAIGSVVKIKGPTGEVNMTGAGQFTIKQEVDGKHQEVKHGATAIGMIAGGSGITPIIQLLRHMVKLGDQTPVVLLYSNQTEADIMLRPELTELTKLLPNLTIKYVLSRAPEDFEWPDPKGRITVDLMKQYLPPPSSETLTFVCGPHAMASRMEADLIEIGHAKNRVHVY